MAAALTSKFLVRWTMTVLDAGTALYVALKMVPEGTRMTIYTRNRGRARTAEVAALRKEPNNGGWGDWEIVSRPKTADASLIRATITDHEPPIIYSRHLAEAMTANPDLWAEIHDD